MQVFFHLAPCVKVWFRKKQVFGTGEGSPRILYWVLLTIVRPPGTLLVSGPVFPLVVTSAGAAVVAGASVVAGAAVRGAAVVAAAAVVRFCSAVVDVTGARVVIGGTVVSGAAVVVGAIVVGSSVHLFK